MEISTYLHTYMHTVIHTYVPTYVSHNFPSFLRLLRTLLGAWGSVVVKALRY